MVSPVQVTCELLERISRLDGYFHSYCYVSGPEALEQAGKAEEDITQGTYHGPLHGVPISIKDIISLKGVPTTCGSPIFEGVLAQHDAPLVQKLKEAGAIILGKNTTAEFALSGYNQEFKAPTNPWNAKYWSGASSSGGGVSVAAGLSFGAVGSDTGGSVRAPALVNGIVGFKPTLNSVDTDGIFQLAPSFDTVGFLSRSVDDAALLYACTIDELDVFRPKQPGVLDRFLGEVGEGLQGLQIAVDMKYTVEGVEPELARAVIDAIKFFKNHGANIVDVSLKGIQEACKLWCVISTYEASKVHEKYYNEDGNRYGKAISAFIEYGRSLTEDQVSEAYAALDCVAQRFEEMFSSFDCLICPSMANSAVKVVDYSPNSEFIPDDFASVIRFLAPYNVSGQPAISIPSGFGASGLPLGIQIVGRKGEDKTILRVARYYEKEFRAYNFFPQSATRGELSF